MSDPMQATSSIPIPTYQTMQGTRDPLPVSSPRAMARDVQVETEARADKAGDAFKDYLDQTSITVLERRTGQQRDAADLISQGSTYLQPGINLPL